MLHEQDEKFNKGAQGLLGVHVGALEENSKKVVEILERLSKNKLSLKDKKALKRIKSELKNIDKRIDALDSSKYFENYQEDNVEIEDEGDDWFAF